MTNYVETQPIITMAVAIIFLKLILLPINRAKSSTVIKHIFSFIIHAVAVMQLYKLGSPGTDFFFISSITK